MAIIYVSPNRSSIPGAPRKFTANKLYSPDRIRTSVSGLQHAIIYDDNSLPTAVPIDLPSWLLEDAGQFQKAEPWRSFHSGGVVTDPRKAPSLKDPKSQPGELNELLKVLFCPEGDDLVRHARAVRILADMLIDLE